ncbi:unnamed protein product [Discosporangium mesarthrocarpum]
MVCDALEACHPFAWACHSVAKVLVLTGEIPSPFEQVGKGRLLLECNVDPSVPSTVMTDNVW